MRYLAVPLLFWGALACSAVAADAPALPGIVSHIKVLSEKVPDVSSLAAWKKSFLREGLSDRDKALAVWKSNVMFVYQDAPPIELLHEGCVHDAIKSFNVYGYGMCCCAASRVESLGRYLGLPARGWGIMGHSVPELFWAGQWHLLDASLVNYFPWPDGKIASVADICKAVQDWLKEHPEHKGNHKKLVEFHRAGGWSGWRRGPKLLAGCPFYGNDGWFPAKTHGWYSTMQEYDGRKNTPFPYEYGYSQGYQVNIQLRPGERLTRNWFHKGLHVNGAGKDGGAPGCLKETIGKGPMAFLKGFGDLNQGRVGSGRREYDVPLAGGGFRGGALQAVNLADNAKGIQVKDPARQAVLDLAMPTSYVYLTGTLDLEAVVGEGGKIRILLSDNNGLDWRDVATVTKTGLQSVDLQKLVLRRYDYRLRLVLAGKGTGLNRLKIAHDVQCSQRALPTLTRGENTITFSAGPHEGTVTIEGCTQGGKAAKQVTPMDFHPVLKDVGEQYFRVKADGACVTFPLAAPGEIARLRLGAHYRVRDTRDRWDVGVSFDNGRTFKTVDTVTGPYQGICKYITVSAVPAGTRQARVRWVGRQRNTTCIFLVRIDADYKQPHGGFRPVRVTYVWEEGGLEKRDVHVARRPRDTWKVRCAAAPVMKSIILELAK